MHGLILISYTEYRTLFLMEGIDPTSNRLIVEVEEEEVDKLRLSEIM